MSESTYATVSNLRAIGALTSLALAADGGTRDYEAAAAEWQTAPANFQLGLMGRVQGQRDHLLNAGEEFVRFATQIKGVQRISLVGSICTGRTDPKDIDFVVEISDDVDLECLAAKGRRLKGRAQQGNVGADIFLVRKGRYIGRICHYRECFPRRACQALHCGNTPHLNDDLATLRLRPEVFEAPPVTIWPAVQRRVDLPEDLEAFLAGFEEPDNRPLKPTSSGTSDTPD